MLRKIKYYKFWRNKKDYLESVLTKPIPEGLFSLFQRKIRKLIKISRAVTLFLRIVTTKHLPHLSGLSTTLSEKRGGGRRKTCDADSISMVPILFSALSLELILFRGTESGDLSIHLNARNAQSILLQ